jgi:hypothetical protein
MPAYRPPTETTFLNRHQETEPFPYARRLPLSKVNVSPVTLGSITYSCLLWWSQVCRAYRLATVLR